MTIVVLEHLDQDPNLVLTHSRGLGLAGPCLGRHPLSVHSGWAWVIALIVFIIGLIMDLVTMPTGIVGVVIDAMVPYLLTRSDTRKFCGK